MILAYVRFCIECVYYYIATAIDYRGRGGRE